MNANSISSPYLSSRECTRHGDLDVLKQNKPPETPSLTANARVKYNLLNSNIHQYLSALAFSFVKKGLSSDCIV